MMVMMAVGQRSHRAFTVPNRSANVNATLVTRWRMWNSVLAGYSLPRRQWHEVSQRVRVNSFFEREPCLTRICSRENVFSSRVAERELVAPWLSDISNSELSSSSAGVASRSSRTQQLSSRLRQAGKLKGLPAT